MEGSFPMFDIKVALPASRPFTLICEHLNVLKCMAALDELIRTAEYLLCRRLELNGPVAVLLLH